LSEPLPKLRVNTFDSINDYQKKANDFLLLMENEDQEIKKVLIKLSDKASHTLQEEAEIKLLKRILRLTDSFNALILISLYTINDCKEYLSALEDYASQRDESFTNLLKRAKEIAKRNREHQPHPSMIS
jgi:poly-D-alanine transfer protein DltD